MNEWHRVEEVRQDRVDAPALGPFEVTATRGSSGYMLKMSAELQSFVCETVSVTWMVSDDGQRIAARIHAAPAPPNTYRIGADMRVSMGQTLSDRYGASMLGKRCRARYEADADGQRIVIWPHDHSTGPVQEALPL